MSRRRRGLDTDVRQGAPVADETAAALVRRITSDVGKGNERTAQIALTDLSPAPWQPRRDYGAAEIDALADSIRRDGLLQPLLARPDPAFAGRYQVVFGHRRLQALRINALRDGIPGSEYTVTTKIRECSDLEARILTSAENHHRMRLSQYEIALDVAGMREALQRAGLPHTDRELARYYERGAGTIAEYRVIGTTIDEALLRAAGFTTRTGEKDVIDWAMVGKLTKVELYEAARSESRIARLERLRRAAQKAGAHLTGDIPQRAGQSANASGVAPRFTVDGLRSRGRFAMKLSRPFRAYSETESRRYLQDLIPAVGALIRNLTGCGGHFIDHGADGVLAYVPGDLTGLEPAEGEDLIPHVRALRTVIEELSRMREAEIEGRPEDATR